MDKVKFKELKNTIKNQRKTIKATTKSFKNKEALLTIEDRPYLKELIKRLNKGYRISKEGIEGHVTNNQIIISKINELEDLFAAASYNNKKINSRDFSDLREKMERYIEQNFRMDKSLASKISDLAIMDKIYEELTLLERTIRTLKDKYLQAYRANKENPSDLAQVNLGKLRNSLEATTADYNIKLGNYNDYLARLDLSERQKAEAKRSQFAIQDVDSIIIDLQEQIERDLENSNTGLKSFSQTAVDNDEFAKQLMNEGKQETSNNAEKTLENINNNYS